MLRAFQMHLDQMAVDQHDHFKEHVKDRWGKKLPPGLVEDLKMFIRLLPQVERRVYALYIWLPDHSKVKDIGGHFLTYMYQPQDFLPENEANGLFGYLDDAYIAALFFELMLDEIEAQSVFRIRKNDLDLRKKLVGYRRKAKAVIPGEAIKIKQMLGELFAGDDTSYQELFGAKISA